MNLIFVDCEAWGGCPRTGQLTEFGAVRYPRVNGEWKTFHGVLTDRSPGIRAEPEKMVEVFNNFNKWLEDLRRTWGPYRKARLIFVSDNPAWDFQWINDGFLTTSGVNPFGHSARRIGDYYAGLVGQFDRSSSWKRLRITEHDHHPVHDAIGNAEAFERIERGER